jgi:ribosomal protein S11
MKKDYNFNINKFLDGVKLKKQYVEKLKDKISVLNDVTKKNYKDLSPVINSTNSQLSKNDYLIMYIINISFSETNTLLHVTDFAGNLEFFCSAGSLSYKGKQKKSRFLVFRDLFRILVSKLTFLKGKPVALHLKNVGSNKFWIIKKLKTKFFIKVIRNFNLYPYNGCRKKKMRRRKFKKEKWLSGLKRQIVNLLSFLIAGSNPAFSKLTTFFGI